MTVSSRASEALVASSESCNASTKNRSKPGAGILWPFSLIALLPCHMSYNQYNKDSRTICRMAISFYIGVPLWAAPQSFWRSMSSCCGFRRIQHNKSFSGWTLQGSFWQLFSCPVESLWVLRGKPMPSTALLSSNPDSGEAIKSILPANTWISEATMSVAKTRQVIGKGATTTCKAEDIVEALKIMGTGAATCKYLGGPGAPRDILCGNAPGHPLLRLRSAHSAADSRVLCHCRMPRAWSLVGWGS